MATAKPGMRPEDIGLLRQVEGPRVSPDGSMVAFTVADVDLEANCYRRRVWLCRVGGQTAPRPFSAGPNDQMPRWSPDGRWLAFSSKPEDGPCEVCVLPLDQGGERLVVARWPVTPSELAWSPGSVHLAFVARSPDQGRYGRPGEERKPKDMPARHVTHLFSRLDSDGWVVDRPSHVMVVPADGSAAPRPVTDGPFDASGLTWSPDGRRIAFASARHETWDLDGAVDLWAVAADGSDRPERLTSTTAAYSSPSWSPDGQRLAYLCYPTPLDDPRHHRLGILDLASGQATDLTTELDRNCDPYGSGRAPVWCDDLLLCSVEDAGNVHIYAVAASGDGRPAPILDGERWAQAWDWAGGTLAMAVTTPTTFPELLVQRFPGGDGGDGPAAAAPAQKGRPSRQLTDLTGPFVARTALSEPVAFMASSADGTEVPCWAMAPVGVEQGRRYPVLVNVHGGPFTSYGNRFFDEFQLETGSGFGVLYCNPRGSSGYGEAWGRAIRWPGCDTDPGSGWGGVDFEDVMACAEEGCRRFDWVDADRLGIMGGSYGGYMTSWAISHTQRFKAACSERAANNLLALESTSDIAGVFRGYVGRTHLEDPGAYLSHSPIAYVSAMSTPVLLVHSEDDLRCPVSQAEEVFVALRLLGRDPVLVRFPGESHELTRGGAPKHRVERAQLILEWFKENLAPEAG